MQLHRDDTDIVLGAPYLNRGADEMNTVGLFLEPLPIRIKYEQREGNFLAAVQEASQDAVSNAIPWNQLLAATGANKDERNQYPNHPLLDIMVTFHDHRRNKDKKGATIPGLEPLITHTKGSKFLLLVEFCAVENDVMVLRIEYDTECIPKREIVRVQNLIVEALGMVVDGRDYSEMKKTLRSLPYDTYDTEKDATGESDGSVFFGRRLNSLKDHLG
jgi:hypothetical protein